MSNSYDPHRLVHDVVEMLRTRGVHAELPAGYLGEALGGAGTLLRVLGVTPALDTIEAFERSAARIWSEDD